jgi:hypothetical protein
MIINGYSYYSLNLEQRSFHRDHELFKPSGLVGHGLGIIGLILILIGVFSYMIRKRTKKLHHFGLLRNWLEFHIFLTILGPAMIIFHTAFKFGGIVAISFWSMIAVVISGVIGRYIYVRIPRTIEGRELGCLTRKQFRDCAVLHGMYGRVPRGEDVDRFVRPPAGVAALCEAAFHRFDADAIEWQTKRVPAQIADGVTSRPVSR